MDFKVSVDIDASPDRVWAVMSDVERWREWTPTIKSIHLFDKPLAVGSRALIRQPKFPPALWKVTAFDRHDFTWRTVAPGIAAVARHWVQPEGRGSRATLSLKFEGLLGPFWGRLTAGLNNRYLGLEAQGLKKRSEER
jgi:hypothetical protein